jgi:hypothetical protein
LRHHPWWSSRTCRGTRSGTGCLSSDDLLQCGGKGTTFFSVGLCCVGSECVVVVPSKSTKEWKRRTKLKSLQLESFISVCRANGWMMRSRNSCSIHVHEAWCHAKIADWLSAKWGNNRICKAAAMERKQIHLFLVLLVRHINKPHIGAFRRPDDLLVCRQASPYKSSLFIEFHIRQSWRALIAESCTAQLMWSDLTVGLSIAEQPLLCKASLLNRTHLVSDI